MVGGTSYGGSSEPTHVPASIENLSLSSEKKPVVINDQVLEPDLNVAMEYLEMTDSVEDASGQQDGASTSTSSEMSSTTTAPSSYAQDKPATSISSASSSTSEAGGTLSPLRNEPRNTQTPPIVKTVTDTPLRTKTFISQSASSGRQEWGVNELISGSPFSHVEEEYFPIRSEPPSSARKPRLVPRISPYRSYYGAAYYDLSSQPEADGKGLASPSLSDSAALPSKGSDAGSSPLREYSPSMSPRVRNVDPRLAPHGSFTSARPAHSRSSSSRSTITLTSIDSISRNINVESLDVSERQTLVKEARRGDQLAQYRLGLHLCDTQKGRRYQLGSSDLVWGFIDSSASSAHRSSWSSQSSDASPSHRGSTSGHSIASAQSLLPTAIHLIRPPLKSSHSGGHGQSDLFVDAAHLAIQHSSRTHNERKM